MNNYERLIDRPRIDAAKAKLAAVAARRKPAAQRLAVSEATLAARQAEHDAALSGDSGSDPIGTLEALNVARQAWGVAIDQGPAIDDAVARAETFLEQETGLAYQPLANDAIQKLFAATATNDDLVAKQAAVEQDFRAALAQLLFAGASGAHHSGRESLQVGSPSRTKPDGVWVMPTFKEMVSRFAPAAGRFLGANPDGTLKS